MVNIIKNAMDSYLASVGKFSDAQDRESNLVLKV